MRSVPVLLPTILVLGLLGAWTGTSMGQLPPPPTVSVPTLSVTVPTVTVPAVPPAPPVPTVTTPPAPTVSAPPVPSPPKPPAQLPVETPPLPGTAPAPESRPATTAATPERHFGTSSRLLTTRSRARPARAATNPSADRPIRIPEFAPPSSGAGVAGVSATAATGRPYEDDAAGPLGAAVDTIEAVAEAVPPVLFALALVAMLLLGAAAIPRPTRTSKTGAALVHHRGTLLLAGLGVLGVAMLSFALPW